MRTIITITFFIMLGNLICAQESKKYLKLKSSYKYREGYIIDKDSIKVKGLIKDNLASNSKKYSIVNFVEIDGTKKRYYPNDLKGFGYSIYKFVSDKSLFYQIVEIGGDVNLYKNVSEKRSIVAGVNNMSMSYSSSIERFYLKRKNETTFKLVTKKRFKEEFSKYFEGCDEIVNDILNEKITYKDIRTIVRKYNYCKKYH